MPETATQTRTPEPIPVEKLRGSLDELVRERQELRSTGADAESLERNRRAIVSRQWDYSRALIARYAA